ncbi:MAG: hypothetical protein LBB07_01975 [Bifidobacteriaceae bacterium]|jgi:hypothetical protein|nr:hypothetical protein [Bifidobacteriaceae bacterium]
MKLINKFGVKRIKLNKIGAMLTVLVLCCVSFTAGVDLTQNANSATSASVLPINKGGTGGNTASIAAANILGANFGNYTGTLPLSKGGTNATNASDARDNLGLPLAYQYNYSGAQEWLKVASSYLGGDNFRLYWTTWKVIAGPYLGASANQGKAPQEFLLLLGGSSRTNGYEQSSFINLSPRCDSREIYITMEPSPSATDPTRKLLHFYLKNTAETGEVNIYREASSVQYGYPPFTPERLTTQPANSVVWTPVCATYNTTPSPAPVPPSPPPSP